MRGLSCRLEACRGPGACRRGGRGCRSWRWGARGGTWAGWAAAGTFAAELRNIQRASFDLAGWRSAGAAGVAGAAVAALRVAAGAAACVA